MPDQASMSWLPRRHPRLYHVAEASSLPTIEQHGLLSTSALLDLFGITGEARAAIESEWRAESLKVSHPVYGQAVIRDQKPLRPAALERCLRDGLTPSDWYASLNRKVFFWVSEKRVERILAARAYRDRSHLVLMLDTGSVLSDDEHQITLSAINSGSAIYRPAPRGIDTFVPVGRGRELERIAELAIDWAMPDVMSHVVAIRSRKSGT